MKKISLCLLVTLLSAAANCGPFRNLGFEEATISVETIVFQSGPTAELIPGWQVTVVGFPELRINYDSKPLNDGFVTLISPDSTYTLPGGGTYSFGFPVEGNYAIFIQGAASSITLSQQGDIPANAKYISWRGQGGGIRASINDVPLTSFDISAFAGQNVKLSFSPVGGIFPGYPSSAFLDSISFVVESDFNGDGAADVLFEDPDGFVGVWFMNEGPDLISASLFNPPAVADPRWHVVGTGDFNTDRKTDLLFQHEDGSLAVWSMDGTNLVSGALLNPSQPGEGWKVVGTGDLNHDGKKDILFQHTDGTLAVWFMDGINLAQGTLLNPNRPGGSGWRVVGTAALSSVGNTDLIFQRSDGTLAAWYMDGTNLVSGALLNPSTPGEEGWRVASTLDLNGDGRTDLLFQHDDGRVAVWLMNGIDLISGEFLNPEDPGSGWRIAGPR